MSNKVILVLLDGLNYQVAYDCMGYLQGLIEHKKGALYKLKCQLPSMSRPLYECILTGKAPVESGVVNNNHHQLSVNESIFSLCKKAHKTTAASAYHWVSELYNSAPFNPLTDRIVNDKHKNIMHGIFYMWDHYPDEAVFIDAQYLKQKYKPDFLFIHPMNIDDTGHKFGGSSSEYRNCARYCDGIISQFIDSWLNDGYQVIITADHGMNEDKSHCGVLDCEREVPMFVFGNAFSLKKDLKISQTQICSIVCSILGIKTNFKEIKGLLNE